MNGATVFGVLELIPDRTIRAPSGTAVGDIGATGCLHPERLALLAEVMHWLSPIYPTARDDQIRFGLFAQRRGRIEEEEEETLEREEESLV